MFCFGKSNDLLWVFVPKTNRLLSGRQRPHLDRTRGSDVELFVVQIAIICCPSDSMETPHENTFFLPCSDTLEIGPRGGKNHIQRLSDDITVQESH